MRFRWSLPLAIVTLALVAAGCGSSHRATQTTTSGKIIVVPSPSHPLEKLPRSVRAAIRRLKALERRPIVAKQLAGLDALVGTGGCYVLARDPRTHKLTVKPRKHC